MDDLSGWSERTAMTNRAAARWPYLAWDASDLTIIDQRGGVMLSRTPMHSQQHVRFPWSVATVFLAAHLMPSSTWAQKSPKGEASNPATESAQQEMEEEGVPASAEARSSGSLKTPAYIFTGVGGLGAAVGSGFLAMRMIRFGRVDDIRDDCAQAGSCGADQDADIDDQERKASAEGVISAISFGVGGAALVTGVTLFLLDDDEDPALTLDVGPVKLRPLVVRNGLGLAGSF